MKRKAMQGRRRHEEQNRERDRGKSCRVNPFDRLRQGLDGLRQRRHELESKERLAARDHHARFGQ